MKQDETIVVLCVLIFMGITYYNYISISIYDALLENFSIRIEKFMEIKKKIVRPQINS